MPTPSQYEALQLKGSCLQLKDKEGVAVVYTVKLGVLYEISLLKYTYLLQFGLQGTIMIIITYFKSLWKKMGKTLLFMLGSDMFNGFKLWLYLKFLKASQQRKHTFT